MTAPLPAYLPHPGGEQPLVEESSATAETFAGRVHVEWAIGGHVTPLGQLPFFIEHLKRRAIPTAALAVIHVGDPLGCIDSTRSAISTAASRSSKSPRAKKRHLSALPRLLRPEVAKPVSVSARLLQLSPFG
jgi:hypothetical protein